MSWYDALHAAWRLRCPRTAQTPLVDLSQFRRVDRLLGATSPPAYQVAYRCPACAQQHLALLTEAQLDVHPVCDPMPAYHDLQLGRSDWNAGGLSVMWAQSVRRRRWPLQLRCLQHERSVGGWPSLLRALEPDVEHTPRQLLVHFLCPACDRPETQQMSVQQLTLIPASWS